MGWMLTERQAYRDHHERIIGVQRYIREHSDEPLNRGVLAAVAGFSVPHLHRVFSACTGKSIARYIHSVRMIRAGRKLRMGAVDITEVALAAGYQTHAAFSRAFKQRFGLSPREFRELDCWQASQLLRKG